FARCARGRLHRIVDEPLVDRGLRADPADGRAGRAAVSRIRDDLIDRDPNIAGDLADHDADDVRLYRGSSAAAATLALVHRGRAILRRDAGRLRPHLAKRFAPPPSGAAAPAADGLPQRLSPPPDTAGA